MTASDDQELWDDIIFNDDGTVNVEAVYKELHDYRMLMEQASRVYWHITCGLMSKPNYLAADVIKQADECADRITRDEIFVVLSRIEDEEITLEEALKEYDDDDD